MEAKGTRWCTYQQIPPSCSFQADSSATLLQRKSGFTGGAWQAGLGWRRLPRICLQAGRRAKAAGQVPCQGTIGWKGRRGVRGIRGKLSTSFHRTRMSLDLLWGHSQGKASPGRSRREKHWRPGGRVPEILFPQRPGDLLASAPFSQDANSLLVW